MTKSDLANIVAEKAELKKAQASKAVEAVLDGIINALTEGDKVQLVGFGSFEVRERAERNAKNPRTGESIVIPATTVPVFKPGSAFKDAVKK